MQYIIRKYLERIDDFQFLPIECLIRIQIDKDSNIFDFWKYLKRGFRDMFMKITEDEQLYAQLKDNFIVNDLLKEMQNIDEWQEKKGYTDEEVAVSYTHLTLPTILLV